MAATKRKVRVSGSTAITGPDGRTRVVAQGQYDQGALLGAMTPKPFAGVDASHVGPMAGQGPGSTAQPVDPALESTRLAANRSVAIGKGDAAYDTGNLGFDYGYNPDGTVNTANPYSRAALYQHQYEDSRRGTTNSLAAQGQLYSGAMANAQGRNDTSYAMAEAANRLGYQRGMHGIQRGQLNTFANAGSAVSDTDWQALLKATYPGS